MEVRDEEMAINVLGESRSIGWQHSYKEEGGRSRVSSGVSEKVFRADEL